MSDTDRTIRLLPAGHEIRARPGATVLAAIVAAGFRVYYGCRGGGCGVCKMRLRSGRIDHGKSSVAALPHAERECGYFLSCQASPVGDVEIEISEENRLEKLRPFFFAGEASPR